MSKHFLVYTAPKQVRKVMKQQKRTDRFGYEIVHVATETGDVELWIDLAALTAHLASRAMSAKARRATLAGGLIRADFTNVKRTDQVG